MIWVLAVAYLWFGWHYADAVMRAAGVGRLKAAATIIVALVWPYWVLMRAATKLAQW